MAIRYSYLEVILTDFKRIKRYFIKRWFAVRIISLSKKLGKTGLQRPRGGSEFARSEDQQAGKRGWKRVRGSAMR